MDAKKITIDRNRSGVYATADVFVGGQLEKHVTIWCALDRYADEYKGKSDDEIKAIAADHWSTYLAASALGRRGGASTSAAKIKASRRNGRKGGRPRKEKDE